MPFNVYGDKDKPSLLIMHGMMNDWKIGYEKMHRLTNVFCQIFPAIDGCYDGSGNFTSFQISVGRSKTMSMRISTANLI
jgi:hypothetical protein